MTMVQEAARIMERMPRKKQQIVLDLLRMMNTGSETTVARSGVQSATKRTGKADFKLPADFDEHFDDLNDEIAAMFSGESV